MRKNKKVIIWILSIFLIVAVLVCSILFFPNVSEKVSGFLKIGKSNSSDQKPGPSETPTKGPEDSRKNDSSDNVSGTSGENRASETDNTDKGFPYVSDGLVKKDAREVFYDCININDRLENGSYADIRIRFADGEDFCVLKNVRFIRETTGTEGSSSVKECTYLCLTEIELLFLSSAQSDCEKYNGTYIYPATCHEKPDAASEPGNYRPSKEVLTLIDEEQLMEKNKIDEFFLARERFEDRLIHSSAEGIIDYSQYLADADGKLPGGLQGDTDNGYWVYE